MSHCYRAFGVKHSLGFKHCNCVSKPVLDNSILGYWMGNYALDLHPIRRQNFLSSQ